jgi:hypothetical protein
MEAQERSNATLALQLRLIDVEVHAVDAFDLEGDMLADDIGNGVRYTHGWLRSTKVLRTTTALCGQTLGLHKQTPPIDRSLSY